MGEMGRKTDQPLGITLILLVILAGFFFKGWLGWEAEGAAGERNPFDLPGGIQKIGSLPLQEAGEATKGGRESVPKFRVTTILISGRAKVAAINGILRQIGDNINGYQIVDIEAKEVILSKGKERFAIKIDSNTGYLFKESKSNLQIMGLSK